MFDTISRKIILTVADNPTIQRLVTKYGMASSSGFARRFVAGETLDEAIIAVRSLNDKGIDASLDLLGESVSTVEETHAARDNILEALDRIQENSVKSNVSVKLTQLGLDLSDEIVIENMKKISRSASDLELELELIADGSVSVSRLELFFAAGANHLVCGTSSVFGPSIVDVGNEFRKFREIAEKVYNRKLN